MTDKTKEWMRKGKYLPAFMRDFHDQKELFKAIDEIIKPSDGYFVPRPNWIEAQCYTVDVFLWFMARRGYTLQRSRAKLPFRSIEDDVEWATTQRNEQATNAMASMFESKP